jgi:hypothetical protein
MNANVITLGFTVEGYRILLRPGVTLVLGAVGSGKTALLRHLCREFAHVGDTVLRYADRPYDGERVVEPGDIAGQVATGVAEVAATASITCLMDDLRGTGLRDRQLRQEIVALQDYARKNLASFVIASQNFGPEITDTLARRSDNVVVMNPFQWAKRHHESELDKRVRGLFSEVQIDQRASGSFVRFEESLLKPLHGWFPFPDWPHRI